MDKKTFQEVFREILNGVSLREIERKYGVNREAIIKQCKEEFPENTEQGKKLIQILKYNKDNSATKTIAPEILRSACERMIAGKITLREAAEEAGVHEQTFNEKMVEFINTADKDLQIAYINYQQKIHPDYSFINFKALVKKMIYSDMSQSEIAREYNIPPRTIGREIEKLKNDETDKELYKIAKEYSDRKMRRIPFSEFEKYLLGEVLDGYDEREVIVSDFITKEEREYRKAKELIEKESNLEGTQGEKAKKLGVGVSTIRRAKKRIKEYEDKQRMIEEIKEEGEK